MRRPLNIKSVISRTVPTTRTRFIRPTGRDDTICRCQPSYEQLMWENAEKEMVKRFYPGRLLHNMLWYVNFEYLYVDISS